MRTERSEPLRGPVHAHPIWPVVGRVFFAVQALAGLAWWICVFALDPVREATLGGADPLLVVAFDFPLFVVASALAAFGVAWARWVVVPWTVLVTCALVVGATLTGRAGWGALAMLAASVGGGIAWMLIAHRRIPAERVLIGPLASRVSTSAARSRQVTRTFVQLAGFWALFLLVLPVLISWFERRWGLGPAGSVHAGSDAATATAPPLVPGAILLLLASALGIWAAITMSTLGDGTPLPSATARRLVVAGPYRFVRNPMALAGILQAVGAGLMLGSWLVVLYALCGAAYWNWLVRPFEEAELRQRFGADYAAYQARVRCWIPIPVSGFGGSRDEAPRRDPEARPPARGG